MAVMLILSLLLCTSAFAAEDAADLANRAKFEKECSAMIAAGGPCADVPKGGGGRRGCVSKPENFDKAPPQCKAVIEEWRAMQKK
jgi:hypothetical protein